MTDSCSITSTAQQLMPIERKVRWDSLTTVTASFPRIENDRLVFVGVELDLFTFWARCVIEE